MKVPSDHLGRCIHARREQVLSGSSLDTYTGCVPYV
ncbi:unnamed protein product [Calypogeia fissa]